MIWALMISAAELFALARLNFKRRLRKGLRAGGDAVIGSCIDPIVHPESSIRVRGVKPRLILLLAILIECFILYVLFAPRPDQSQQATDGSTQWRNDPTPAQESAIRRQIAWDEWRPRLFWILLVVNSVFTITCAVRLGRRRP